GRDAAADRVTGGRAGREALEVVRVGRLLVRPGALVTGALAGGVVDLAAVVEVPGLVGPGDVVGEGRPRGPGLDAGRGVHRPEGVRRGRALGRRVGREHHLGETVGRARGHRPAAVRGVVVEPDRQPGPAVLDGHADLVALVHVQDVGVGRERRAGRGQRVRRADGLAVARDEGEVVQLRAADLGLAGGVQELAGDRVLVIGPD